jgi:hypothetical protein
MCNLLALIGQLERGDDLDVEQAIAVIVEQRDTAAARFEDVILGAAATERPDRDTRHFFKRYGRNVRIGRSSIDRPGPLRNRARRTRARRFYSD